MNIFISNANGEPIYQQIVSQFKAKIIAGELKEGDALPSMRLLAKELRISVITTKRAYEELEREGFIVSYTGKGSFVAAPNREFLREQKLKETESYLEKAVAAARAGAPNKLIQTHCASACYMGAAGNGALGTELADEFLLAEPVDLFGLSSFPAWLMGNTREEHFLAHMINLDMIGAAARGKTFYQVELQGGAGKPDVLGYVTPDKYDMRVWNWNIITAGGKGAVYWQYAYEPAGVESPGFGLTGFEHENTERSLEAGRCARYFQEKGLDETVSVLSMNGICISRNASLFLFAAERQEKMYADSLLGAYKVCADAGIPVRFVHTDYLKDAWDEGLCVLYVPMAIALSGEEQNDILAFAEKGGKVVVEAAAGFYDERGEMDVRTSLLKKVFEAEDFSVLYQENVERGKENIVDKDGRLVCKGVSYVQTMEIHKGDELGFVGDVSEQAKENGHCAYARSPYGKGCVEWIGTYPAMMAKREADEACTAFVQNAFVPQGYDFLRELKAEGLIVRMLRKEGCAANMFLPRSISMQGSGR